MPRREPDGDTGVEVTIDRIRDIERELEDLKAFVAGKLPHDHDSRYDDRYVHESGDTMSGVLDVETGVNRQQRWGDMAGTFLEVLQPETDRMDAQNVDGNGTARARVQLRNNSGVGALLNFIVFDSTGSIVARFWLEESNARTRFLDGDVQIDNALNVSGSKNALIVDPDDATKAFRFACVEADEPGLLFHRRTVTIPTGGSEATVDLPPHWSRIAKDGDAMVTPLNDTRDQAPAAAVVDLSVPEVTVRGKPGDYRVWVAAARADVGVDGWTHEVEVTPDDEDV